MKIIATSDLHGFLPVIPTCDLLIIAGDVCPVWNHRLSFQRKWLDTKFRAWLEDVPARHIVGVWGNHDLIAQQRPPHVPDLPWTVLTDELHEFDGLRIYGLPWQLRFFDWAFCLYAPELAEKYDAIPECDVIVSHGPPYGFGDFVARDSERVGCRAFNTAIERSGARLAVYGHIHGNNGQWPLGSATLANVALVNEAYQPVNAPMAFELAQRPDPVPVR
jgi:hypothetical protein